MNNVNATIVLKAEGLSDEWEASTIENIVQEQIEQYACEVFKAAILENGSIEVTDYEVMAPPKPEVKTARVRLKFEEEVFVTYVGDDPIPLSQTEIDKMAVKLVQEYTNPVMELIEAESDMGAVEVSEYRVFHSETSSDHSI